MRTRIAILTLTCMVLSTIAPASTGKMSLETLGVIVGFLLVGIGGICSKIVWDWLKGESRNSKLNMMEQKINNLCDSDRETKVLVEEIRSQSQMTNRLLVEILDEFRGSRRFTEELLTKLVTK